ncbi:MAG: hypothetical protein Q9160_009265 [Pyrenula sp. 1 TL-2023]
MLRNEEEVSQSTSSGNQHWYKYFGRRIKLALAEPEFSENVRMLGDFIRDFRTLRAQAEEFQSKTITECVSTCQVNHINKFTVMQDTSQMLYEALTHACTKHDEHLTRFSLLPSFDSSTAQIQFNLALRNPPLSSNEISERLIWLMIESSVARRQSLAETPKNIQDSSFRLKESLRNEGSVPISQTPYSLKRANGKPSESIRFENPVPHVRSMSAPVSSTLPDLCKQSDLCDHLKDFKTQMAKGHDCIGFLEVNVKARHLIYVDSNLSTKERGLTKSLLDFFPQSGVTAGQADRFWEYERLQLAHALSTAVLQFHPTPWIPSSLNSGDVHFDLSDSSAIAAKPSTPKIPFVDIPIRASNSSSSQLLSHRSRHFAPNHLLFRLGVILLELAFEAPLKSMQKPEDGEGGLEDRDAEFLTAKRVNRTMSSTLGTRYSSIVRKCLQCDFGRGDDLRDAALQEAFFKEVIRELDQLEQGFRKLQIAI